MPLRRGAEIELSLEALRLELELLERYIGGLGGGKIMVDLSICLDLSDLCMACLLESTGGRGGGDGSSSMSISISTLSLSFSVPNLTIYFQKNENLYASNRNLRSYGS